MSGIIRGCRTDGHGTDWTGREPNHFTRRRDKFHLDLDVFSDSICICISNITIIKYVQILHIKLVDINIGLRPFWCQYFCRWVSNLQSSDIQTSNIINQPISNRNAGRTCTLAMPQSKKKGQAKKKGKNARNGEREIDNELEHLWAQSRTGWLAWGGTLGDQPNRGSIPW